MKSQMTWYRRSHEYPLSRHSGSTGVERMREKENKEFQLPGDHRHRDHLTCCGSSAVQGCGQPDLSQESHYSSAQGPESTHSAVM